MAEMYVVIDVYFNENDGEYYANGKLNSFLPLMDRNLASDEERIQTTLQRLEREDMGPKKYRMEALWKIYGNYLMSGEFETVTPFHHRFKFICGSGGVEFARDFCFMIYAFEVAEITARITHDESEQKLILKLNTQELWQME